MERSRTSTRRCPHGGHHRARRPRHAGSPGPLAAPHEADDRGLCGVCRPGDRVGRDPRRHRRPPQCRTGEVRPLPRRHRRGVPRRRRLGWRIGQRRVHAERARPHGRHRHRQHRVVLGGIGDRARRPSRSQLRDVAGRELLRCRSGPRGRAHRRVRRRRDLLRRDRRDHPSQLRHPRVVDVDDREWLRRDGQEQEDGRGRLLTLDPVSPGARGRFVLGVPQGAHDAEVHRLGGDRRARSARAPRLRRPAPGVCQPQLDRMAVEPPPGDGGDPASASGSRSGTASTIRSTAARSGSPTWTTRPRRS